MQITSAIPSVSSRSGSTAVIKSNKRGLYIALNAMMITIVSAASLMNGNAEFDRCLYIVTLFAICSSPLLFLSSLMGKELLVLLYLTVYFITFCALDLVGLFVRIPVPAYPRNLLFTQGETAIILGAACLLAGYAIAATLIPKHSPGILRRDWSPNITTFLGLALWAIGFYFAASLQFGVADAYAKISFDPRVGGFFTMFRMMQPLGTLILIYRYLTTRKKGALILLLATMVADAALGFVGDTKQLAVQGPLLYLVCVVALRQRFPIKEAVVFIIFAGFLFNFSNQYRDMLHTRAMTRGKALESISSIAGQLERTNKDVNKGFEQGIRAFAERITLKYFVELVVAKTGKGIEFQNGHTIKPLLFAFAPRFILPDKEDNAMTGRLFNAEFHITDLPSTYVAIGQLGEL